MSNKGLLRTGAVTLAALGCVLLAACGGSGHPGDAAHTAAAAAPGTAEANGGVAAAVGKDPCSLLTQAQVDTAAGQSLGAGQAGAEAGACQWSTADFAADVDLTVADWPSIKAAATGVASQQPVTISGVGDQALNLNGSNGSLLYVRKGGVGFLLSITDRTSIRSPITGWRRRRSLRPRSWPDCNGIARTGAVRR